MCTILIILGFLQSWNYGFKREFVISNIAILGIELVALMVMGCVYARFENKFSNLRKKTMDKYIYVLGIILFFSQMYIAHNIYFYTMWDVNAIVSGGKAIAESNINELNSLSSYFSRYPNNLLATVIEGNVYRLNNAFGIYQGSQELLAGIMLNCILSSVSCVLIYKILRSFVNEAYSLGGVLLVLYSLAFRPG